jgi:hypothetical protein
MDGETMAIFMLNKPTAKDDIMVSATSGLTNRQDPVKLLGLRSKGLVDQLINDRFDKNTGHGTSTFSLGSSINENSRIIVGYLL